MDSPKIKGAAIREFFRWYVERFGQDYVLKRYADFPDEIRKQFDFDDPRMGVIASEWYPAEMVHKLLERVVEGMAPAERARLLREGAQATLTSTVRGVYKLLFDSFMTPERYARRSQTLFSRYFNTGVMSKAIESSHAHLSEIRDWTSHHPLLCDFILYVGETVYGAMGCRDVASVRLACVSDGNPWCAFRITWTE
jgi:hypothetical protein